MWHDWQPCTQGASMEIDCRWIGASRRDPGNGDALRYASVERRRPMVKVRSGSTWDMPLAIGEN